MSISNYYPHKLALLQVALRAKKLRVNAVLNDAAELAVMSSLLVFANAKDLRMPITVPRKTIGEFSMLGRSALYLKLSALEQKNLIEREGERVIRFTEHCVQLLEDNQKTGEKSTVNKIRDFFRVGKISVPKELVSVFSKDLSEKQILSLLAEAKRAGIRLQDKLILIRQFSTRYEGATLYLVIRDMLRHPGKYAVHTPGEAQPLTDYQHKMLQAYRSYCEQGMAFIKPGEKLTHHTDGWWHVDPTVQAGAPQHVTATYLTTLAQRMQSVARAALAASDGVIDYQDTRGHRWQWNGEGNDYGATVSSDDGRVSKTLPWIYLVGYCPVSDGLLEVQKDERVGLSFIRKGIRYLIENITADQAQLRAFLPNVTRICLIDPQWLAGSDLQWCE